MNDYDRFHAGGGGRWRTPYTTTEVNEDTPGSEPRQPVSSCSCWRSGIPDQPGTHVLVRLPGSTQNWTGDKTTSAYVVGLSLPGPKLFSSYNPARSAHIPTE